MYNPNADYSNNVIYKIFCKDPNVTDIYIGHTTDMKQRYRLHRSNCNVETSKGYNYKIYKIIRENGGWNNWEMVIIENFPCEDVNQARDRERYWIEKESSSMNMIIPNRSKKEYSKIYAIVNKEKIAEKSKIYRAENKAKIDAYLEANKEKISFQKKDWYEEKKDYILEKAKQNYQKNKEDKLEYQKQYSQQHKKEIAEKQKEYREKNKDKLSEQKKIYREEHKEEAKELQKAWREANKEKIKQQKSQVINCECGSQYTFGNKHRHLQTKIHLKYINECCDSIPNSESNKDNNCLTNKQSDVSFEIIE